MGQTRRRTGGRAELVCGGGVGLSIDLETLALLGLGKESRSEKIGRAKAARNPRGVRRVIQGTSGTSKQGPPHYQSWRFFFLNSCLIPYIFQDKRSHSKISLIL